MTIIFFIILSYLIGSIPIGYILTRKVTGKNIMEHGSGNIGSTNVKRIVGKKTAVHTQLLDMLKGLLPVSTFLLLSYFHILSIEFFWIYPVALASITGHIYSPFLKFKGGKGVNTTLGASILISPVTVLISVVIYYFIKWRSSTVSLGSLAIALSLILFEFIFPFSYTAPYIVDHFITSPNFFYFIACAIFIIYRHKDNIKRLLNHEENKI